VSGICYVSLSAVQAIFAEDSSKDELQDVVYSLVHPEMLQELQHEIENEMEQEVQEAVKKDQQVRPVEDKTDFICKLNKK